MGLARACSRSEGLELDTALAAPSLITALAYPQLFQKYCFYLVLREYFPSGEGINNPSVGCFLGQILYLNEVRAGRVPCTDLVIRVYLQSMIATSLLAAAMLNEVALNQHLDVALDGLRGDARLSLKPRHLQAGMSLDAVEDNLLALV